MPYKTSAKRDTWIALLGLVLLLAWEASGWDRTVTHWFGGTGGFPLRDAWLTSTLVHEGGRAVAWTAFVLLLLDTARPWLAGPSTQQRRYWLGATLAGLMLVPGLKRLSQTSCPWDLAEFGGSAPYVPHWALFARDGGPGHCFPSGHAVAAFAFLSLYFLWRPHRPVLARWLLGGVTALGLLFGGAQLARGAHFPSHTFWSAWLCWTLCAAASRLQQRQHAAVATQGAHQADGGAAPAAVAVGTRSGQEARSQRGHPLGDHAFGVTVGDGLKSQTDDASQGEAQRQPCQV